MMKTYFKVLALGITLHLGGTFPHQVLATEQVEPIDKGDQKTIHLEVKVEGTKVDLKKPIALKPEATVIRLENNFVPYEDPFLFVDIIPASTLKRLKELHLRNADFRLSDQTHISQLLSTLETFSYSVQTSSFEEALLFVKIFKEGKENQFAQLTELEIGALDFTVLEDCKTEKGKLILGIVRTCPKLTKVRIDGLNKEEHEDLMKSLEERRTKVAY